MPVLLACLLSLVAPTLAGESDGGAATSAPVPTPSTWLGGYEAVHVALVGDDVSGAVSAARSLATLVAADPGLGPLAAQLGEATDLAGLRAAFAEFSRAAIPRLAADRASHVVAYHCPMFEGYGYWVQPKSGIANPYMGRAMPECGEEVSLKAAVKAASR